MFRQIFHRIDRFALIADFEMQLDLVAIGIAHFGNLLAPFHQLFFLDQNLVIMGIRRQDSIAMLDNDQIAITVHVASVQDSAIRSGNHFLSFCSGNIDTPVFSGSAGIFSNFADIFLNT